MDGRDRSSGVIRLKRLRFSRFLFILKGIKQPECGRAGKREQVPNAIEQDEEETWTNKTDADSSSDRLLSRPFPISLVVWSIESVRDWPVSTCKPDRSWPENRLHVCPNLIWSHVRQSHSRTETRGGSYGILRPSQSHLQTCCCAAESSDCTDDRRTNGRPSWRTKSNATCRCTGQTSQLEPAKTVRSRSTSEWRSGRRNGRTGTTARSSCVDSARGEESEDKYMRMTKQRMWTLTGDWTWPHCPDTDRRAELPCPWSPRRDACESTANRRERKTFRACCCADQHRFRWTCDEPESKCTWMCPQCHLRQDNVKWIAVEYLPDDHEPRSLGRFVLKWWTSSWAWCAKEVEPSTPCVPTNDAPPSSHRGQPSAYTSSLRFISNATHD